MADTADVEALDEIEIEESPAWSRALSRALLAAFGTSIAAGAVGGFAFLIQNDEFRGTSFLAALIGALIGAVLAIPPAIALGVVLAVAAQRCRTARRYRAWVTASIVGLAVPVPVIGLWLYRSFSYDLRDDDRALAVALGASVVVAELLLLPSWRMLRAIREDEADGSRPPSSIPNPYAT